MAHDDFFIPDPDQKPWLLITRLAQLTLELYDTDTNTFVPGGASCSGVDTLQMIYLPAIKPGTYQLRVGKPLAAPLATAEEMYALAFFAAVSTSRR